MQNMSEGPMPLVQKSYEVIAVNLVVTCLVMAILTIAFLIRYLMSATGKKKIKVKPIIGFWLSFVTAGFLVIAAWEFLFRWLINDCGLTYALSNPSQLCLAVNSQIMSINLIWLLMVQCMLTTLIFLLFKKER
ncbi:hypothetical protein [Planctobacterium marinum]|uniref:hypothetical protein n=1 Tax=Planctobacterium marinum TaxID=1631968 RepID=UPI0030C66012